MEIANIRIKLNKVGSDVPKNDVTPAEAMLLHILHGPHNGGETFGERGQHIKIVGTAKVDTGERVSDRVRPAVPAHINQGKVVKVGIVGQPARGEPGRPGYVAAIQSVNEEREPDTMVPEVPAEVITWVPVLRDRTDAEELSRLISKYGGAQEKSGARIVNIIWPDRFNPRLPQTFKEIKWAEVAQASSGIVQTQVNYATGSPATLGLPIK